MITHTFSIVVLVCANKKIKLSVLVLFMFIIIKITLHIELTRKEHSYKPERQQYHHTRQAIEQQKETKID